MAIKAKQPKRGNAGRVIKPVSSKPGIIHKAGGGTVNQEIIITKNGTYEAPSGVAYKKITVNVE